MIHTCPKCPGDRKLAKNGTNVSGTQRYRCTAKGCTYSLSDSPHTQGRPTKWDKAMTNADRQEEYRLRQDEKRAIENIEGNMVSNNANGDFQERINRRFLREYAFYLQAELDVYVCPVDGVNLLRHGMRVSASSTETIVTVEFVHQSRFEGWIEATTVLGFTIFRDANDRAIAYQFTEESLYSPSTRKLGIHLDKGEHGEFILHICRQSDPRDWSNVQAWEDSNNAIALMLAQRGTSGIGP